MSALDDAIAALDDAQLLTAMRLHRRVTERLLDGLGPDSTDMHLAEFFYAVVELLTAEAKRRVSVGEALDLLAVDHRATKALDAREGPGS